MTKKKTTKTTTPTTILMGFDTIEINLVTLFFREPRMKEVGRKEVFIRRESQNVLIHKPNPHPLKLVFPILGFR